MSRGPCSASPTVSPVTSTSHGPSTRVQRARRRRRSGSRARATGTSAAPRSRLAVGRNRKALLAQGAYYVATGVAPFVSRRAFEAVTGPKKEWWLVETVGVLVTAVGGGILVAAGRDRVTPELVAIAIGCAGGLAAIDVVHVSRGRIAPTYLLD